MQQVTVCGVVIDVDDATGLALSIEPIRIGGVLGQAALFHRSKLVDQQFRAAAQQLETDLQREVSRLPNILSPLCQHDPVVDNDNLDSRSIASLNGEGNIT